MSETIVTGTRYAKTYFEERGLKFKFIGGVNANNKQVILSNNKENSVEIEGLQASVSIEMYGATMLPLANVEIYNLPVDLANQISTMGLYTVVAAQKASQIIIYGKRAETSNGQGIYSKIFQGSIVVAYDDYNATPERITYIQLTTMGEYSGSVAPSVSFKGEVSAEEAVRAIVINDRSPILRVQNMNVNIVFNNPNFYGDIITQLNQCAKAGNFQYAFRGLQTLYIYPKGASLTLDTPIRCSPYHGMIGYPKYSSNGIIVRNVFIPSIVYGQAVEIRDSQIQPANGVWENMVTLKHKLSCLIPEGEWETEIEVSKQAVRKSTAL
ncbi:hypothetical protein COMNV_00573 [Commensalibacter sp. Nvir]|uniref:baseplate hub protein n=1 Tax=Commensalibacter sp. Nvir TaxID=3069817 RepID=UPI002D439630|nr:hypothetical protein COMNV_00573 [Commensalibacter sp. Nvir]